MPKMIGLSAIVTIAAGLIGCSAEGAPTQPDSRIQLSIVDGDGQTGTATQFLGKSLRVRATLDGRPVSGLGVTWTPGTRDQEVSAPYTFTDSEGIAEAQFRLGPYTGESTLTASLTGRGTTRVLFAEEGTVGMIAEIRVMEGASEFLPREAHVLAGGTVKWVGSGLAYCKLRPSGSKSQPGKGRSGVGNHQEDFPTPGVYPYECASNDGTGTGTVVVE